MKNVAELKNLTAILFTTCENWTLPSGDQIPLEEAFTFDLALFLLYVSKKPANTVADMDWLKENQKENLKALISEEASLPFRGTEIPQPFLLRAFQICQKFSEASKQSVYSGIMELFFDFFRLLGQWILEREGTEPESEKLLAEYLQSIRNCINGTRSA